MWWLLLLIPAALLVFLSVILIRAVRFTPKAQPTVSETEERFDRDRVVENLRSLIRFPTVSYRDPAMEDDTAFEGLIQALPTLYPNVFKTCELQRLPDRALLFRWKGKTDGAPAVMMAHYDVVPVNEEAWDVPPFEAILKDGRVFGRGALDTKVTFGGALFAADHLIAEGFTPERDLYLAFSGGEEVNDKEG